MRELDQTKRAGAIIRGLRSFVEKGETRRRDEEVNATVEEAVALALTGEADKNIKLELDLGSDLPKAAIDRPTVRGSHT